MLWHFLSEAGSSSWCKVFLQNKIEQACEWAPKKKEEKKKLAQKKKEVWNFPMFVHKKVEKKLRKEKNKKREQENQLKRGTLSCLIELKEPGPFFFHFFFFKLIAIQEP